MNRYHGEAALRAFAGRAHNNCGSTYDLRDFTDNIVAAAHEAESGASGLSRVMCKHLSEEDMRRLLRRWDDFFMGYLAGTAAKL